MHAMATVSPYVQGTMILRTLGIGGYGRVVLARDPRPDGPERSADLAMTCAMGTTRKKILWEAAVLRQVAHAHAIRLFDVRASTPGGEEDPCDLPTLVFPAADVDLATFLDRRPDGVLPTMLARRMMGQLAAALAHVHSQGIIHRDVKPGNCLIFLAGEVHGEFLGPNLVLADFGMARRVSGHPRRCLDARQTVHPMTAMVCTAWYRPPELWAVTMDEHDLDQDIEEAAPYGTSLDVWSFGAVVYEVLAGETLARRARNGAKMAQAVAGVIGPCPAQGLREELAGAGGLHWSTVVWWCLDAHHAARDLPAPSRPLPRRNSLTTPRGPRRQPWRRPSQASRWQPLPKPLPRPPPPQPRQAAFLRPRRV